jgi:hypothetical protein
MTVDRDKLQAGRGRALELLSHPDPAVREPAKRALDHAEVAPGLLDAMDRQPAALGAVWNLQTVTLVL